jgi:hypothetical protein
MTRKAVSATQLQLELNGRICGMNGRNAVHASPIFEDPDPLRGFITLDPTRDAYGRVAYNPYYEHCHGAVGQINHPDGRIDTLEQDQLLEYPDALPGFSVPMALVFEG